jgi:hypothetical protein
MPYDKCDAVVDMRIWPQGKWGGEFKCPLCGSYHEYEFERKPRGKIEVHCGSTRKTFKATVRISNGKYSY